MSTHLVIYHINSPDNVWLCMAKRVETSPTVAAEIKDSMSTGVLRNNRNDTFNRMSRALTRNSLADAH